MNRQAKWLLLMSLLLMVVFRSLLVPLKAVIMNLLSIAAAYGVVVAVFQWGWLNNVLNVPGTGPIFPFLPIMVFAILFVAAVGLGTQAQVAPACR